MALSGAHLTHTEEMAEETPFVLHNGAPDDDPNRDAKDVAFAQAYLEKARHLDMHV